MTRNELMGRNRFDGCYQEKWDWFFVPDGKVLVAGGDVFSGPQGTTSAELYNPTTGLWASTESMNYDRELQKATLLLNGQVLVTGGYPDGSSSTTEIL